MPRKPRMERNARKAITADLPVKSIRGLKEKMRWVSIDVLSWSRFHRNEYEMRQLWVVTNK
jgi:hypothetical protein